MDHKDDWVKTSTVTALAIGMLALVLGVLALAFNSDGYEKQDKRLGFVEASINHLDARLAALLNEGAPQQVYVKLAPGFWASCVYIPGVTMECYPAPEGWEPPDLPKNPGKIGPIP